MQVTNNTGLPDAIYQWVNNKEYSSGGADISVTDLIDSPRVRILEKRHDMDLTVDASKLLRATMGTSVHKAIESATKIGISERRLSIKVNGWWLSGGMDHYEDGVLTDYKTTNVFKTVYSTKGRVPAFEQQLNVYAEILRQNGHPVTKLMIFAIFTDWRRNEYTKARKEGKLWIPNIKSGWPDKDHAYFEINLWPEDIAKNYVEERIKLHQEAEQSLPLCSPEDLWRGLRCREYCGPGMAGFCEQFNKMKETGVSSEI